MGSCAAVTTQLRAGVAELSRASGTPNFQGCRPHLPTQGSSRTKVSITDASTGLILTWLPSATMQAPVSVAISTTAWTLHFS